MMDEAVFLKALEEMLDRKLDERFKVVEKRFDALDERMDRLEARMDSIETRMDHLEARINDMQTQIDGMQTQIDNMQTQINELAYRQGVLEINQNRCFGKIVEIQICQDETNARLDKLSGEFRIAERSIRKDLALLHDAQDTIVTVLEHRGLLPIAN